MLTGALATAADGVCEEGPIRALSIACLHSMTSVLGDLTFVLNAP